MTTSLAGFTPQEQRLLNERPLTSFEQGLDLRQVAYMREQAYLYEQGQISEQAAAQESLNALSAAEQQALITDGRLDLVAAVNRGVPDLVLRGVGLPQAAIDQGRLAAIEQQLVPDDIPILPPTVADLTDTQPIYIAAEPSTTPPEAPLPPQVAPSATPPVLSVPVAVVAPSQGIVVPTTIPAEHVNALQGQLGQAQQAILRGAPELVYERIREFWLEFNEDVDGLRQKYEGSADFYPRAIRSAENNISAARRNPNLTPEQVTSNVANYQARIDKLRIDQAQNRQAMADFDRYVTAIRAQINETIRDTLAGIPLVVPVVDTNRANVLAKLAPYQSEGGYDLARAISDKAVTVSEAATIFDPLEVVRVTTIPQIETATAAVIEVTGDFDPEAERDAEAYRRFGPEAVARQAALTELQSQGIATPTGEVYIPGFVTPEVRSLLIQYGFEGDVIDQAAEEQRQREASMPKAIQFAESRQPFVEAGEKAVTLRGLESTLSEIENKQTELIATITPETSRPFNSDVRNQLSILDTQKAQVLANIKTLGTVTLTSTGALPSREVAGPLPFLVSPELRTTLGELTQVRNLYLTGDAQVAASSPEFIRVAAQTALVRDVVKDIEEGRLSNPQGEAIVSALPIKPGPEDIAEARYNLGSYLQLGPSLIPILGVPIGAAGLALTWEQDPTWAKALGVAGIGASVIPLAGTAFTAGKASTGAGIGIARAGRVAGAVIEADVVNTASLLLQPQAVLSGTARSVRNLAFDPIRMVFVPTKRVRGIQQTVSTIRVPVDPVALSRAVAKPEEYIGLTPVSAETRFELEAGIIQPDQVKKAVSSASVSLMQTGKGAAVQIPGSQSSIVLPTPLVHQVTGAGAFTASPDIRGIIGDAITVAGSEGGLFVSPTPLTRFADSTSGGKKPPTVREVIATGEEANAVLDANPALADFLNLSAEARGAAIQTASGERKRLLEILNNARTTSDSYQATIEGFGPGTRQLIEELKLSEDPVPGVIWIRDPKILATLQGAEMFPSQSAKGVIIGEPGNVPKIYRHMAEIEAVVPNAVVIPKASQMLDFIGPGNVKYAVAVIGEPVSPEQLRTLQWTGLRQEVRNIFQPPALLKFEGRIDRQWLENYLSEVESILGSGKLGAVEEAALRGRVAKALKVFKEGETEYAALTSRNADDMIREANLLDNQIRELRAAGQVDGLDNLRGEAAYLRATAKRLERGILDRADLNRTALLSRFSSRLLQTEIRQALPISATRGSIAPIESGRGVYADDLESVSARRIPPGDEITGRRLAPGVVVGSARGVISGNTTVRLVDSPRAGTGRIVPTGDRIPGASSIVNRIGANRTSAKSRVISPRIEIPVRLDIPRVPDIPPPPRFPPPPPSKPPPPDKPPINDGKFGTQPSKLPLLLDDHPKRVGWNTGVFDTTVDLSTGEVEWHKDLPEIPEIPAEESFRVLERGLRPSLVREFPMGKAHVTISGQGVKFRGRRTKRAVAKARGRIAYESPGR